MYMTDDGLYPVHRILRYADAYSYAIARWQEDAYSYAIARWQELAAEADGLAIPIPPGMAARMAVCDCTNCILTACYHLGHILFRARADRNWPWW